MKVEAGLQKIGFSKYESKVYVALVSHPSATGYEVSKYSKVPRAKVYEVLDKLVERGVVLVVNEEDKKYYQPLPYDILLSRYQKEVESTVNDLREDLRKLESVQEETPFYTLRGYEDILIRITEMVLGAKKSILLGGFALELAQIKDVLKQVEDEGKQLFVLQFGHQVMDFKHLFFHNISPKQKRQIQQHGRWFSIVVDMKEALLAQIKEDGTTALWTENLGVVLALSMWMQHDITLNVLLSRIEDQEYAKVLLNLVNEELTEVWNLGLEDIPYEIHRILESHG